MIPTFGKYLSILVGPVPLYDSLFGGNPNLKRTNHKVDYVEKKQNYYISFFSTYSTL